MAALGPDIACCVLFNKIKMKLGKMTLFFRDKLGLRLMEPNLSDVVVRTVLLLLT